MDPNMLASLVAKYPMTLLKNGNVRTSPVRLSFANGLFKAKAVEEGKEKKYSVSLLFPVGADLSILYNIANTAAVEKFKDPSRVKLKSPFLRQDDEPYDGYQDGGVYLRVTSPEAQQPQCIDLQGRRLLSETDCYSGCWALATLRGFAYDKGVNKGVAFGVQNIVKIADDDRFSGRSSADEEFADILQSGAAVGGVDMSKGPGQFF
jgi:hypothetical protein